MAMSFRCLGSASVQSSSRHEPRNAPQQMAHHLRVGVKSVQQRQMLHRHRPRLDLLRTKDGTCHEPILAEPAAADEAKPARGHTAPFCRAIAGVLAIAGPSGHERASVAARPEAARPEARVCVSVSVDACRC